MEELKEKIKTKYAWKNSDILCHGQNYFLAASKIYKIQESTDVYPLLTLLGLSAELFFKAFHVDLQEEYLDHGNGIRSIRKKSVKTLNNGKDENGKRKHNGHKLEQLLEHYLVHDTELFNYLIITYKTNTKRDLQEDLLKYSSIFEHSRYIFEDEKKRYLNDVDVIFDLVKSLYDSVIPERVSTSD